MRCAIRGLVLFLWMFGCSNSEPKTVLWGSDLLAAQDRGGLVLEPGHFNMGSPAQEPGRFESEELRPVTIQRTFVLATTEVTQAQYEAVMGKNPSKSPDCGSECPVDRVSWMEAVRFCNQLSEWEQIKPAYTIEKGEVTWDLEAPGYRLPTEAEWEYAARAGLKHVYSGSSKVDEVAWYGGNSKGKSHPVARLKPNHWGFYDMSGNVREWVWDRWEVTFSTGEVVDPAGPETGVQRVNRGGSWSSDKRRVRAAYRRPGEPDERSTYIGFRVARTKF